MQMNNNMQGGGRNMYGTYYEPDCCGCFPLECGVRTLFFLTFLGAIGTIVNIIIGATEGQWFVLFQVLMLPPAIFTLFYVLQWMQMDNFYNRNKISQGFRCMFITNVIVNLVILFVVIFAINEFWDTEEVQNYITEYTNNQTYNQYGNYYGNQYATYNPNVQNQLAQQQQYVPPGNRLLQSNSFENVPPQQQFQDFVNQGQTLVNQGQNIQAQSQAYLAQGQGIYAQGQAYYNQGQNIQAQAQAAYAQGQAYNQQYNPQGYYQQRQQQISENSDEIKTGVIVAWALVYGGFILVFGFLAFYWWTVVKRWAGMLMNQVQPYGNNGGMGGMGGMMSPPRSPQMMMSPTNKQMAM